MLQHARGLQRTQWWTAGAAADTGAAGVFVDTPASSRLIGSAGGITPGSEIVHWDVDQPTARELWAARTLGDKQERLADCVERQRRSQREAGHTECAECGELTAVSADEAAAGFVCAACEERSCEAARAAAVPE